MRRRPVTLADIARKWSKAHDRGKGITLSAEELDVLNAAGAGVLIMEHAAATLKETAIRRLADQAD